MHNAQVRAFRCSGAKTDQTRLACCFIVADCCPAKGPGVELGPCVFVFVCRFEAAVAGRSGQDSAQVLSHTHDYFRRAREVIDDDLERGDRDPASGCRTGGPWPVVG